MPTNLTSFTFRNSGLNQFPEAIHLFNDLQSINLRGNAFGVVNNDSLPKMEQPLLIDLRDSQLTHIDPGAFSVGSN